MTKLNITYYLLPFLKITWFLFKMTINPTQLETAIAQYETQIANNPQLAENYLNLGHLYTQKQQWQQAQDCYQKAVEVTPEFAEAHYHLAQVLTNLDNCGKAADHLNLALRLDPNLATPQQHYKLAKTLQGQNKPGRAISAYHRAINSHPSFLAAYKSLGKFFIQQAETERAIALYRQGVEKNPQNPQFHLALGQALAKSQEWLLAIESYQTTAQLQPDLAELYRYWGQALVKIQKNTQAEALYKKAIALQPDDWESHFLLGILLHSQKDWQQALLAYQQVRAIKPNHHNTLNRMAVVHRHLQQYDLAIACHRQAINNLPESSSLEKKAIAEYQLTLAKYPEVTAQNYYQFAQIIRSRGLFSEAIAAYQQTIERDPQFKLAYIDLQYIRIPKHQFTQLIEFYRSIVARHPNITIAWGNLGDALSQESRIPEAIECYQKGCYQQAVQTYPYLAKLDWKAKKESGPDFIIAGASKCGTSSIYHYLGRHPQVLLSHKKEIDFYWKNFKQGIDWYLAHFPTITDSPDFLTGEATPNYLRFPHVARRIKETFPKTKIIILLRNPADRAISWHYHKFNTGLTNQDLTTAIASEIKRLATISEAEITKTSFYNPDNILSGLYVYKIKPWIEILGREQFLILKSEDFYQNTAQKMAQVHDFLGLPDCTLEQYPPVNAGTYNQIDASLRKTLVEYFAPYNQKLESYLGMKFDWD
jgi:tetratricopeptide (TPR) repeat protein